MDEDYLFTITKFSIKNGLIISLDSQLSKEVFPIPQSIIQSQKFLIHHQNNHSFISLFFFHFLSFIFNLLILKFKSIIVISNLLFIEISINLDLNFSHSMYLHFQWFDHHFQFIIIHLFWIKFILLSFLAYFLEQLI